MVFLLQILPDFSGVQSGFDRDLVKVRSIFGVPLSCGKNGKMGKIRAFFSRNRHIAQNVQEEFVQYNFFEKEYYYIIKQINRINLNKSQRRKATFYERKQWL